MGKLNTSSNSSNMRSSLKKKITMEKREGLCEKCNREYRVWAAASPLWNATIRGGTINGPEEYDYLCANCFMELAEDRGIASLFQIRAEKTTTLETTTPSGRTWDENAFVWKDPNMKYRIHYTLVDGSEDSFVIEGNSIEEIRDKATSELLNRNGRDAWSEEIKEE